MRQKENHRKDNRGGWYGPLLIALFAVVMPTGAQAQSGVFEREYSGPYSDNGITAHYADFIEFDPTLEVEIWTDNESGYYYQGDEIKIYFRASDDCYVTVYNVDTEGRVNLIYPFDKYDDQYIEGGRIYRIPDVNDDYDLVLRGPAGTENIQIIASRTPFPTPDWYEGSNLVSDRDRYEFLEYVNGRYFGCRSGCLRALDQVSFVVRKWDNYYYRPVYYSPWPYRHHYGGLYIDYYWGSSIYVDGYFYGIAPLYLPRLSLGYHHVTIFDHHGHGWESRIHINRHDHVTLDNTIIRTGAGVKSRYRSVNRTKYRDPLTNGYPDARINKKHKPRAIASGKGSTNTLSRKSGKNTTLATTTGGPVRGFGSKKKSYSVSDNSGAIVKNSKTRILKKSKSSDSGSKRLKPYKLSRSKKSAGVRSKSSSGPSKKVYKSRGSSKRSSGSESTIRNKNSSRKKSARSSTFESRGSKRSSPGARSGSSSRKSSSAKATRKSAGSKSHGVKSKSSGRSKSASVKSSPGSSRGKSSVKSSGKSGRSSSAKSSGRSKSGSSKKGGSRKR